MIYYMADPMDLLQEMKSCEQRTISLPSGGMLNVEILDDHQARVTGIISTDPMDYMIADLQPGNLITLSYTLAK